MKCWILDLTLPTTENILEEKELSSYKQKPL